MNAIDLTPELSFRPAIVREIDFDPTNGVLDLFRIAGDCAQLIPRVAGTSSSPSRSIQSIETVGSPLTRSTSANSRDRLLEVIHASAQVACSVPAQLAEIKRLSGYGWERIAFLLGRTRQAVHRWSLGEAITDENRDRLSKLHALMLYIDRGDAEANRGVLSAAHQGMTLADLLAEGRFDEVRSVAGGGAGRPKWGAVDKFEAMSREHWYDRLFVDDADLDDRSVRAKPQTSKRLRMRQG